MKKLIILCLTMALFISCKKNPVTTSPFLGNWTGTYTGTDDNGTFLAIIAGNGDVTGTITSSVFGQTFNLTGTVTQAGQFQATTGTATSGATFSGTMSGTTASGTWTNSSNVPPISGNWSGTKQ